MSTVRYAAIFLLSLTLVAQELIWTRILSAEFFYTFAFLILSLAILGLGTGALAVRLFRPLRNEKNLWLYLSLTGLMGLASPPLIFVLGMDFAALLSSWLMVLKLLAAILLLSSAFFCGGMALAILFREAHREIARLYMWDLVGAGAGVLVAMAMMNEFGTPVACVLSGVPVLVAAILVSPSWRKAIAVAAMVAMAFMCPAAAGILEAERPERAPVIYKHWDAMAKVKLYDYNGMARGLEIDNVANSPVYQFDGDWAAADTTEIQWGIDVSYLIDRFDSCTFLSLGAGGGTDVLQALVEGATEVHAVEVNPHINHMMIEGDPGGYLDLLPDTTVDTTVDASATAEDDTVLDDSEIEQKEPVTLAEFSGQIYNDPRVRVVSEDARAYVRRFENKFDVIYSLSSNTWAALGSGSFALAENYLFTTEAFRDYWRSLTDSGFLSMEHQVYMPRLVTEVLNALEDEGVDNPKAHLAVYNLPSMRRNLMLLSKQPLTEEIRQFAYGELTPEKNPQIHLLYPSTDSSQGNLIARVVDNGWRSEADTARIDLSPATDNRPFVAQMGLWRNLTFDEPERFNRYAEFSGFPVSRAIIVVILLVVLVLIIPLNFVPYLREIVPLRFAPWLYYFAIGFGFMAVEVVLIQKYALFIGASIYSIATVLLVLLVASGVGSRLSGKVRARTAFGSIVGLLVAEVLLLTPLTSALGGLPMFARVLVSAILVAPLGFFMGMPFPKATRRVGELVDWGFAVNGAASVLGAVLVLLVAFEFGFTVALIIAAGLYLCAYLLFAAKRAW